MPFALIPMKDLSRAKARLAPALDEVGRRELARALLRDVLAAATACPAFDGVAVAAGDPNVLALADESGAEPVVGPGGLNEALTSASRTLSDPLPSRIEHLVRRITTARLLDGQLEACQLTLSELRRIEQAFVRALCSMYHGRIVYPSGRSAQ